MKSRLFFQKRVAIFLVVVALLAGGGIQGPVFANGGTNGLLNRMEKMTDQMEATGELSPEDAQRYRQEIQDLRQQVDERMAQEGSISPYKDKDLYNAIDKYNKPLFDAYQKSNAKVINDPRRLLNAPPF